MINVSPRPFQAGNKRSYDRNQLTSVLQNESDCSVSSTCVCVSFSLLPCFFSQQEHHKESQDLQEQLDQQQQQRRSPHPCWWKIFHCLQEKPLNKCVVPCQLMFVEVLASGNCRQTTEKLSSFYSLKYFRLNTFHQALMIILLLGHQSHKSDNWQLKDFLWKKKQMFLEKNICIDKLCSVMHTTNTLQWVLHLPHLPHHLLLHQPHVDILQGNIKSRHAC